MQSLTPLYSACFSQNVVHLTRRVWHSQPTASLYLGFAFQTPGKKFKSSQNDGLYSGKIENNDKPKLHKFSDRQMIWPDFGQRLQLGTAIATAYGLEIYLSAARMIRTGHSKRLRKKKTLGQCKRKIRWKK